MVVHPDSTSIIARAQHSGAGPGQQTALLIRLLLNDIRSSGRSASITWVKGRSGVIGNERADVLAGAAAERFSVSSLTSITHLKLKISERFRTKKEEWHSDPANRHHPRNPAWKNEE
jgi:hypothetical protein